MPFEWLLNCCMIRNGPTRNACTKELWKLRLRPAPSEPPPRHSSSSSTTTTNTDVARSEQELKAALHAVLKRLEQGQLEKLLEAVRSRGREPTPCMLISRCGASPATFRELSGTGRIIAQTWKWQDLAEQTAVRNVPGCERSSSVECVNPHHLSRVVSPCADEDMKALARDYSAHTSTYLVSAGLQNLRPSFKGTDHCRAAFSGTGSLSVGSSSVPFSMASTSTSSPSWCKLAYWEGRDRVGSLFPVRSDSVRVFEHSPQAEGLYLGALHAGNPPAGDSVRRARARIGAGICLEREPSRPPFTRECVSSSQCSITQCGRNMESVVTDIISKSEAGRCDVGSCPVSSCGRHHRCVHLPQNPTHEATTCEGVALNDCKIVDTSGSSAWRRNNCRVGDRRGNVGEDKDEISLPPPWDDDCVGNRFCSPDDNHNTSRQFPQGSVHQTVQSCCILPTDDKRTGNYSNHLCTSTDRSRLRGPKRCTGSTFTQCSAGCDQPKKPLHPHETLRDCAPPACCGLLSDLRSAHWPSPGGDSCSHNSCHLSRRSLSNQIAEDKTNCNLPNQIEADTTNCINNSDDRHNSKSRPELCCSKLKVECENDRIVSVYPCDQHNNPLLGDQCCCGSPFDRRPVDCACDDVDACDDDGEYRGAVWLYNLSESPIFVASSSLQWSTAEAALAAVDQPLHHSTVCSDNDRVESRSLAPCDTTRQIGVSMLPQNCVTTLGHSQQLGDSVLHHSSDSVLHHSSDSILHHSSDSMSHHNVRPSLHHQTTASKLRALKQQSLVTAVARQQRVHKVLPGECIKAYDYRHTAAASSVDKGEGPAGDSGTIHVSFVKGWGAGYTRQTVTAVPCWLEVLIDTATIPCPVV